MTTTTQHAAGMFCWIQLATSDEDSAKKFYRGLFGWNFDDTEMGGRSFTVLKKDDNAVGALYGIQTEERQQGVAPNWMPFIAVDNADKTTAKIKQIGGKVVMEPFDIMQNGRMALFQDPTGGTFSVWQAGTKPGAAVVNETASMCWNELITDDAAKAGAFYKQAFNWTDETKPMPQGTYTIFKNDGAQAAGMMQATKEMRLTHPYWLVYFGVDDCDKSAARAEQLGGKVGMPPADIPNIGRFSVLIDPQGAYFAIIARAKQA